MPQTALFILELSLDGWAELLLKDVFTQFFIHIHVSKEN